MLLSCKVRGRVLGAVLCRAEARRMWGLRDTFDELGVQPICLVSQARDSESCTCIKYASGTFLPQPYQSLYASMLAHAMLLP